MATDTPLPIAIPAPFDRRTGKSRSNRRLISISCSALLIPLLLLSTSAAHATSTFLTASGTFTTNIPNPFTTSFFSASGPSSLSPYGSATVTASGNTDSAACVGLFGGAPGTAAMNFAMDFGGGNTLTGTLTVPCVALVNAANAGLGGTGTGTGSGTITGGTGRFAGASGSFPSLAVSLTITGAKADTGPDGVTTAINYYATFQTSGNGTLSTPAPQPPGAVSVQPASGITATQLFVFQFSDPGGFQALSVVDVLVNSSLDGRQACYVAFVPKDATSGSVYLVDNAGDAGGPYSGMLLPSSGTVSNSQCSITATGSSVLGSGNTLTLTLAITFTASFAGNKVIYLAAQDATSGSGWQALGTWGVPGFSTFPSATAATPGHSTGSSQTFTFTYTDTKGAQDLGVLNVLINNFLDGRQACYIAYSQPFKVLYLVGDAGGGLSAGLTLGGSGSVGNGQCTVSANDSSATASGNTLTLVLKIGFTAAFDGNRVIYLAARDSTDTGNSGWQPLGSTTVQ